MVQKINPHPAPGCNRSPPPLQCILKRCNSWECSVHFFRGPWLRKLHCRPSMMWRWKTRWKDHQWSLQLLRGLFKSSFRVTSLTVHNVRVDIFYYLWDLKWGTLFAKNMNFKSGKSNLDLSWGIWGQGSTANMYPNWGT